MIERVNQKAVTLKVGDTDYAFRLTKLDAFAGAALLRLVCRTDKEESFRSFLLEHLSEQELKNVMTAALEHVEVRLDAGWQPVMQQGEWGWEEIRYDPFTCLALTAEECAFTLGAFFPESGARSPAEAPRIPPA